MPRAAVGKFLAIFAVLFCSAASALVAPIAGAATTQDFDTPGSVYVLAQDDQAPPPQVLAGGATGNFLRLSHGVNSNAGSIGFDATDRGAYCDLTIDLDFRITPTTGTSGHGLSVRLLPTADPRWSYSGSYGATEETGLEDALTIAFDPYDGPAGFDLNDNHVSIRWNNSLILQVDATPVVDIDNGTWIHAQIRVDADGAAVSVDLTPSGGSATTLINALPLPGLKPHEWRLNMAARSSNQIAEHDVDNISVTYAACPSVLGAVGPIKSWPIVSIHGAVMPNGKVLLFDGDANNVGGVDGDPYIWDPVADTIVKTGPPDLPSPTSWLFCAGHTFLEDGRLFTAGGMDDTPGVGDLQTSTYDGNLDDWVAGPLMNGGRWYPTTTRLTFGDVVIVGGSQGGGVRNDLPQVYEAATGTLRDLTTAVKTTNLYPLLYLAPDGRVFHAGPAPTTNYLDTSGTGAWSFAGTTSYGSRRLSSTSALLEDGRVLLTGGDDPPTNHTEVWDLNAVSPSWQDVEFMDFERRHPNATLLPDGTLFVSGGTASAGFNDSALATLTPELFDPVSNTWRQLAAHTEVRMYHSIALLLPDASILLAGGGRPTGGGSDFEHFTAEIYSPPYLFQGSRPTITSSPTLVQYGASFEVLTPDGPSIAKVSLMGLGSVTHSVNMGQSLYSPSFATSAGGLTIDAPLDPNIVPPGPYMLFLVDNNGVPSEAAILTVAATPVPASPAPALALLMLALLAAGTFWLTRGAVRSELR